MSKNSDIAKGILSTNAFWYVVGGIALIGGVWYLAGSVKRAVKEGANIAEAVVDDLGNAAAVAVQSPISLGIAAGRKIEEFLGPPVEQGHSSSQYSLIRDLPLFPEWYGIYWESPSNRWMVRPATEDGIIATLEALDLIGYIATISGDGHVTAIRRRE